MREPGGGGRKAMAVLSLLLRSLVWVEDEH